MAQGGQTGIRLRLIVETPVPGVAYSLQDKKSQPVDARMSNKGESLTFEFPVRVGPGPKFYGEQVRSEGPERRFVYIGVGQHAGQKESCWSRRMKIDIHTLPQALLDKAAKGKTLEAALNGAGKDGTPACATIQLTRSWRAV